MTSSHEISAAGLDGLLASCDSMWSGLNVRPVQVVRGFVPFAGTSRPLLSSALRMEIEGASVWLPAPEKPARAAPAQAPVYLHAGRHYVLPFIRLLDGNQENPAPPRFLTLSHWLCDAGTRWRFRRLDGHGAATVREQLEHVEGPADALKVLALLVRFALFGSDRYFRMCGLSIPPCPMWLRPVPPTRLGEAAARSLVVSARLAAADDAEEASETQADAGSDRHEKGPAIPSTRLRAAAFRIDPAGHDWCIDPVHTLEGDDIRLTGRLGAGVGITAHRRLQWSGPGVPLSISTARIPFAGHNDPRRLLMAANMQLQAMEPVQVELPQVRNGADTDLEPPGVNLRVGYLAWRGWNHEDAWVISESAAARLTVHEETIQTIAIRAVELPPEWLVKEGDTVRRGQLLLRRRVVPCLLSASLQVLAKLTTADAIVPLRPEFGDHAAHDGTIEAIATIDLAQPTTVEERGHVDSNYRLVHEIRIRRVLPLSVGDKLANRHGHKGIVGAILPDEAMPRWQGQPLEALIDPISVLNRSNWGQLQSRTEFIPFCTDSDPLGRSTIEAPINGDWLRHPVHAVAGVQFVLRLPHHACDKISGSPLRRSAETGHVRSRAQRFGEMDHWALWAHACAAPVGPEPALTPAAQRLKRLLHAAGFALERTPTKFTVAQLNLETGEMAKARRLAIEKGVLAEALDLLEKIEPEELAILVFDPPVRQVPTPPISREAPPSADSALAESGRKAQRQAVHWLPILPACDRPPRRQLDGSEEEHELTYQYRQIIRLARRRTRSTKENQDAIEEELRHAIAGVLKSCYAQALGLTGSGLYSSKLSWLRRGVLGNRLTPSARATIAPSGTLGLALDEIGLPRHLASILFGIDEREVSASLEGQRVWIKRDPVLHRWGLLPVRVRLVDGMAVRLPASLLGPLGADFDGDTVALFASLPGVKEIPKDCTPPALAWHPMLREPMFVPTKQYLYGLHLLQADRGRLAKLEQALSAAGAPAWPGSRSAKAALAEWVQSAVAAEPQGRWWTILEEHALDALSENPGADLGLYKSADDLAGLEVVQCGAAKNLYEEPRDRLMIQTILDGKSLAIYSRRQPDAPPVPDPIADVMVAARASIGQFGGTLRRILYSAASLTPDAVRAAQCLTERMTQKALSVKGGKPVIRHSDFERQLRRLLRGQRWELEDGSPLKAILEPFKKIWEDLRKLMPKEPVPWLQWLRSPQVLAVLLSDHGALSFAADDVRLGPWLESPAILDT